MLFLSPAQLQPDLLMQLAIYFWTLARASGF